MQPAFGGGDLDGYAILLDLDPAGARRPSRRATAAAAPALPSPGPTLASFERGAKGIDGSTPRPRRPSARRSHSNPMSPAGSRQMPSSATGPARFWPGFLYGKPVEGSAKATAGGLEAAFTLTCTSAAQPNGDQSRRVLGELFHGEQPPSLRLTLESLGPRQTAELAGTDAKGRPQTRTVEYCQGEGDAGTGRAEDRGGPQGDVQLRENARRLPWTRQDRRGRLGRCALTCG